MGSDDPGSAVRVGRTAGILFLVQAVLAPPVYTAAGLMRTVIARDFLENAAGSAMQIRCALLLVFVLGGITLAVALIVFPVFRRQSERMALLYLALAVVGVATQVIETVTVRIMLALSVSYTSGSAPREILSVLGPAARSAWSSAHFTNLLLGHITVMVFFVIVYRFAFVPRVIGVAGIAATLLSSTAATMPLLGSRFSYASIAPAALAQLALTGWLLWRGFGGAAAPARRA